MVKTYKEFTNLNSTGNLLDLLLYLQDRNMIHFAPHIGKFGNDHLTVLKELYADWLEVAKSELKERNEMVRPRN